jgi:RHS repeat-associated protein
MRRWTAALLFLTGLALSPKAAVAQPQAQFSILNYTVVSADGPCVPEATFPFFYDYPFGLMSVQTCTVKYLVGDQIRLVYPDGTRTDTTLANLPPGFRVLQAFVQIGGHRAGNCTTFAFGGALCDDVNPNGVFYPAGTTIQQIVGDVVGGFGFPLLTGPPSNPYELSILGGATNTVTGTFDFFPSPVDVGPCRRECESVAGSPISLSNGDVSVAKIDYAVPGLLGGLNIARTYNSLWSASSPPFAAGIFGTGWTSSFEDRLQTIGTGKRYWSGSGNTVAFDTATGAVVSPVDFHATLTSAGGQSTITFADGSRKTFNAGGYLVSSTDRNGNATTLTYDATNRVTTITAPGGQSVTLSYGSSANQVTTLRDSVGVVASYLYTGTQLTQVAFPDGGQQNYTYDANGFLASVTDEQGRILETHSYDADGRGLTSARANGVDSVTVQYSPNSVALRDSLGNTTTYTYTSVGGNPYLASVQGFGCDSCGATATRTFQVDSQGNRLSETDGNGNTTSFTYDANGNVLTRTDAIGTVSYTYNSFAEVLTARDQLGNTTTMVYDAKGNLLSTTAPSPDGGTTPGPRMQFTYDAKGQLLTITDPLGHTTTTAYFASGLVSSVKDAQKKAGTITFVYDARGNRTSMTDSLSRTTAFQYDSMNRVTQITAPDSSTTRFTYDTRGRRTATIDALNRTTTEAYDDADRVTSSIDTANRTTTFGYDTENNLTAITDALNRTTSMSYDAARRLTQLLYPSGLSESYSYDANGNLVSRTDRNGHGATYVYDAANRLSQGTTATNSTTYTYDAASRMTQVIDNSGTYAFSYDGIGRLLQTTTTYAGLSRTFISHYTYDGASNRTSFADPEGSTTSYAYDVLNRLTTITPPAAFATKAFTLAHDNGNRRTSLARPNGVTTTYTYDKLSRLLSAAHVSGRSTVDGISYTLDAVGNRRTAVPMPSGAGSAYTYDGADQLVSAVLGSTTTEAYTYDAVANRLSALGVGPWVYSNSDTLTSRPGVGYTYDNNGNELTKTDASGTTMYSWDAENRLASVTLPSTGGVVTFAYDPFGRRIRKSTSAGTSYFVYDGTALVEEVNTAGTAVARYVHSLGVDEPLAMLRGGTTSYFEADGLGSITTLTTKTGTLAATYTYDAFGNVTATTGSVVNPFLYAGREYDAETGLYYDRARYYDPKIGRFISGDPTGFSGSGTNLYAYVHNSAPNSIDPSGLSDNASPWQVGWEWLTGTGPSSHAHNFTDGDPFTELLRRHEHIQDLINKICTGNPPPNNRDDYELGGVGGVPKYFRDYTTLLTGGYSGNLAATYLGSYGLSYSVTGSTLNIHVWNNSTVSSATHPPVIGYTNWWNQHIGNPLDNFFSSGPMSKTSQYFDFHENLKQRCKCKQ